MKRLNKFLAECGVGSRRKCDVLIQEGRIAVGGEVVQSLGQSVDESREVVTVDGRKVSAAIKLVYILLNKPKGYVTTVSDELGRKTVLELIPKGVRVFPVGRLDKDTTGALLLTNDGDLTYKLTHPKYNVKKVYQVLLSQPIIEKYVKKLQNGIMLEDGVTRHCLVKIIGKDKRTVELTLMEGRKREIRRMLQALGYDVLKLKRTKFATLSLVRLSPGKWRYLTEEEIEKIRSIVSREG